MTHSQQSSSTPPPLVHAVPGRALPGAPDPALADPIGAALSRAYAATLAEPLPPALADLLRSLD